MKSEKNKDRSRFKILKIIQNVDKYYNNTWVILK